MEDVKAFKKTLSRLTPATANNEQCVNFVKSFEGDYEALLRALVEEMNRSSLNGRVKQLNFLEYCAGIVGNCEAPPVWNKLVASNLQKFVDAAVPIQLAPPCLVNVEPARRFVRGFQSARLIDPKTAERIIAQINSKQQNIQSLAAHKNSQNHRPTREEVLRRMEDDRERAKKYKERELAVNLGSKSEFDLLWSSTGAVFGPDYASIKSANTLANLF